MVRGVYGWAGLVLAIVGTAGAQAASWQTIFAEAGRKMEIDRASIQKEDGGKVLAWGRIVFDRPMQDVLSGNGYRVLEAMNRYDCEKRSFSTLKRIYRRDESEVLREEENKNPAELPVRSGTLDDKVLRVACRPPGLAGARHELTRVVEQANEATAELKKLNDGTLRKEVLKANLAEPQPVAARPARKEERPPVAAEPARLAAHRPRPAAEEAPHHPVHWAYEGAGGPENWARIDPENRLCAAGQRQSPIDLREGIRVDLAPLEFRYRPSLFRIVDNGHTVQVAVGENSIRLLGKDYELVQLHFHRPAEERVAGRSFAMVAHLVHRADDGKLAVLAVLLEPGREQPLIQTLWNHLPLERNDEVAPPATAIDLNQLLPENRSYYTYMGSLTTPPCSEGVLWLVLKQPVEVSPEQIAIFARLYRHNARPIQAANGRLIKESR